MICISMCSNVLVVSVTKTDLMSTPVEVKGILPGSGTENCLSLQNMYNLGLGLCDLNFMAKGY